MTFNKIGLSALLLVGMFGSMGSEVVSAQMAYTAPISSQCLTLSTYMRVGATDYSTGGTVTALQNFLVSQGYFNSAYMGTGRFGPLTYAALVRFQAAQGLPATGYAGPLTAARIQAISCGSNPVPPTAPVSLYNINPTSGAVGSTVSITGFGMTNDNTILFDGSVAARNIPIISSIAVACTTDPACRGGIRQTITFTVPTSLSPNCPVGSMCPMYMRQVTPGTYAVSVVNTNGTSNTLTLTVTAGTSAQPLSITGLDTPTTLALGQQGTWTVRVAAGSTNGNLHYSVVWGDESAANTSIMAPQPSVVQTSSTFTHIYSRSGTYTPYFTVSDDAGHTVTASASVLVTPLY